MLTDDTLRVIKLVSHDQQFSFNANQGGKPPIVLNQYDLTDPKYVDQLDKLVSTDGNGGDLIARCQCGDTEGNNKIGMTCPVCHTQVTKNNLLDSNNLLCRVWVAAPSELPHGWLSPKLYLTMVNWLTYKTGRNYLDDILDPDADLPFDIADVVQGRGFTYLYENFERLMNYFCYEHPVISKKPDTLGMRFCLQQNADCIFCHHIPVLNSAISPVIMQDREGPDRKRYTDPITDHVRRAAISLSRLEFSSRKRKHRLLTVERTAYKAFKDIIAYVQEATHTYLSVKKAIPRSHIFGSRLHQSFRAVIVPIIGPHFYYELHAPWRLAVNTLRVHLMGALIRNGMHLNDAAVKVRRALQIVDPDIKQLMDQMIADSPFHGIPCLFQRPPSIREGSVKLLYWTKIKDDISDSCIGITSMDVAFQNADYDGDALAGVLIPETDMADAMRNLSQANLVYDYNGGEITSDIGVHKSMAVTINSFLGNFDPVAEAA